MKKLKKSERDAFVRAIDDDYRVHWMVDNLPVGMFHNNDKVEGSFSRGFPVGFHTGTGRTAKHFLYNHIRITVEYHDDDFGSEESSTKIVGFRVEPMSIKHTWVRFDLGFCESVNNMLVFCYRKEITLLKARQCSALAMR